MGLWNTLFGSGKTVEKPGKTLEYNGFEIIAEPFKAASGWQLAGRIAKGGKEHKFIRADQFTSRDEAEDFAITKGMLIVDQLGDAMFKA